MKNHEIIIAIVLLLLWKDEYKRVRFALVAWLVWDATFVSDGR